MPMVLSWLWLGWYPYVSISYCVLGFHINHTSMGIIRGMPYRACNLNVGEFYAASKTSSANVPNLNIEFLWDFAKSVAEFLQQKKRNGFSSY